MSTPPIVKALQKSSHRAYAKRQVGTVDVPAGWIRHVRPSSRSPGWIRMITLAIDPANEQPAVTATDLKLLPNGKYLYVVNEEFNSKRMNEVQFLRELERVVAGATKIDYMETEIAAREFLNPPRKRKRPAVPA